MHKETPFQILAPDGEVQNRSALEGLGLSPAEFIGLYKLFLREKFFHIEAMKLAKGKELPLYIGGEGQEADMGSVFAAKRMGLKPWLSYYARTHGPALIRLSPKTLLLAFFFYNTPPPHVVDEFLKEKVALPTTGVGYNITQSVGLALALQEPVICYFGDGACAEPEFSSGLNLATIWNAPVLFYCENNGIAISTPASHQTATATFVEKARGLGEKLYVELIDGDDPFAAYAATKRALNHLLAGRPAFIEATTYRRGDHTNVIDGRIIVTDKERQTHEDAMALDPEIRFRKFLLSAAAKELGIRWTEEDDAELREMVLRELKEDFRAARDQAKAILAHGKEEVQKLKVVLTSPSHGSWDEKAARLIEDSAPVAEATALDALAIALHDAISLFPRKFLGIGNDIGRLAGVMRNWGIHERHLGKILPENELEKSRKYIYRNYLALQRLHPNSIIDATLDEPGMAGLALGYALADRRVVLEPQFSGFYMSMWHQLDEAGRLYQHHRGKLAVPLTLMMIFGSGERIERHNEDETGDISQLLGWTVACPHTVQGFYDLALSTIISNKPGAVFLHIELLRRLAGTLKRRVPRMIEEFGVEMVEDGGDLTLVTYGKLVGMAQEAAKIVREEKGVSTKILALELIAPLDALPIVEAVKTTGRLLVVQEGPCRRNRLGAEIVRRITGDPRSFNYLERPPQVMAGAEIYPAAPGVEKFRTPQVNNIARAICRMAKSR